MYWLWVILAIPLVFLLAVLLLKYFVWCRAHKDFVSMEDRRESLRLVNHRNEPDRIDEWYRRKLFEHRYNRATKRVRKRNRL